MTAIFLILVWWILSSLAAPTWCFVVLAVIAGVKCIGAFFDAVKAGIELYDNRKK